MSESSDPITKNEPGQFFNLTPDLLLETMEDLGLFPTGEYTQLNSYENRVFEIRLEPLAKSFLDLERVIVKAYRPNRWSLEAIQEEHDFIKELKDEGLPAVAPIELFNNSTMYEKQGFIITLFPKIRGRLPQEFLGDDLVQVGRTLARLHNIGARKRSVHRGSLDPKEFSEADWTMLERFVTPELWHHYENAMELTFGFLDYELNRKEFIRIHGDCHRGNLLHTEKEFFFVDFDDYLNGPAAQDFWMLNQDMEDSESLYKILEGYEELRSFPPSQFKLLPALRAFRIIRYALWIAKRWKDPTFPLLFPNFGTYSYWAEELRMLDQNLQLFAN